MTHSSLIPTTYIPPGSAPSALRLAAAIYERRFNVQFSTLTGFTNDLLEHLHSDGGPDEECDAVHIASSKRPEVADLIHKLGGIANQTSPTQQDHEAYFDTVLAVYERLPIPVRQAVSTLETLVVAPQREGRDIAYRLGALPAGRHMTPIAKRIQLEAGLAVGIALEAPPPSQIEHVVLIDGVIASGATVIAILEALRPGVKRVEIFTAHATSSGLRAVLRYGKHVGIGLIIYIGHVSGNLNSSRYALDADGRLTVGDLGDLIAPAALQKGSCG